MSGVRATVDAIRSRAARTSSSVSGSMCLNPRPAELDADAGASAHGLSVDVRCRREIFDRESERLEQRDLLRVAPWGRSVDQHFANSTDDVIRSDPAGLDRCQQVAWLLQRGLTAIDVEPRPHDRRRVELTRRWL